MADCLIGAGSNIGDRAAQLTRAVDALRDHPQVKVRAVSRWLETPPVGGPTGQGPFLNGAIRLETSLAPRQLLDLLHQIERQLGRMEHTRWEARLIDLDILLYDREQWHEPDFQIPHAWMGVRSFVLIPAAEIASEMIDPNTGWNVGQLLRHLQTTHPYAAVAGAAGPRKIEMLQRVAQGDPKIRMITAETGRGAPRAGGSRQQRVEFLRWCGSILRHDTWPNSHAWTVSDFWLEEGLCAEPGMLADHDVQQVYEEWERVRSQVVTPRFLVVLRDDGPPESAPSSDRVATEHEALDRQSRQAHVGPVLRWTMSDPQRAAADLLAALQAAAI